MVRIAVTGGIACGKTRLGTLIKKSGVEVCEADDLVHGILRDDTEICRMLLDKFGKGILGKDNLIDRQKLGNIVFADLQKLRVLTSIIHPMVKCAWEAWLENRRTSFIEKDRPAIACVIIPLLYELNLQEDWDAVICVQASEQECRNRIAQKGVLHFARRIELQISTDEKAERADYVIVNNGTLTWMDAQWRRIYEKIMESK